MSRPSTYSITVTIQSGRNLPKADMLGKIDAFVRMRVPGHSERQSRVVDKDYNPNWNWSESFTSVNPAEQIYVEVRDQDPLSTESVAYGTFPIICGRDIKVPLTMKKGFKPHGGDESFLIVSVAAMLDWASLWETVKGWPGVYQNNADRIIILPLPYSDQHFPVHGVNLGIQYEKGDSRVDIFLLETEPNHMSNIIVGFGLKPNNNMIYYKTVRKAETTPYHRLGLPKVYAETKLDDLTPWTHFEHIQIFTSRAGVVWDSDVEQIAVSHGWKGMLNYQQAKATLKNVICDDKHESVYMMTQYGSLMIDYDKDNCDFVFGVQSNAFDNQMIADISHAQTKKRKHKFYLTPKIVNNVPIKMEAELDDLPTPCYLNSLKLKIFQNTDVRRVDLLALLPGLSSFFKQ